MNFCAYHLKFLTQPKCQSRINPFPGRKYYDVNHFMQMSCPKCWQSRIFGFAVIALLFRCSRKPCTLVLKDGLTLKNIFKYRDSYHQISPSDKEIPPWPWGIWGSLVISRKAIVRFEDLWTHSNFGNFFGPEVNFENDLKIRF